MNAHTKLPWGVFNDHPDEETKNSIAYIRPANNGGHSELEIATIYLCDEYERKANARLIAAAPELLAALKSLAWAFKASIHDHEDSGAWQAAQDAIAKAEGK